MHGSPPPRPHNKLDFYSTHSNALVKESGEEETFMWWMIPASLITLLPFVLYLLPALISPSKTLLYLTLSGLFQAFYYYFLGRAYQLGELSLIYPMVRSSPLILLILSTLILCKRVPLSASWGYSSSSSASTSSI